VYVRLLSLINGAWQTANYTFTASGQPTPAALTAPTPGSTLTGSSETFTWSPGTGVQGYEFWVGTGYAGASNIYNSGYTSATTANVTNLPTDGATVYVRLLSLINGAWQTANYTFTGAQ
jgi:hypothetical protein